MCFLVSCILEKLLDKSFNKRLYKFIEKDPVPAPISNHFKLGFLKYSLGIKFKILFTKFFGVYIIP